MQLSKFTLVSLFFLILPIIGNSQNTNVMARERLTAHAVAISTVPEIDGNVLNDGVWRQIEPFGNLSQLQPNYGQAASEKTEIRIAYNTETFYVAVVCHDTRPNDLVVSSARRDANLDNTDAFIFILDTYKDNQNGFVFGTNPLGVEYDAQRRLCPDSKYQQDSLYS